jgi:hypothetical protein
MLWAATLCVLLLGHVLASRPLPSASAAENAAHVRTLATLLELPANSLATIVSAVRRLPGREMNGAVVMASRTRIEAVLEETGG